MNPEENVDRHPPLPQSGQKFTPSDLSEPATKLVAVHDPTTVFRDDQSQTGT